MRANQSWPEGQQPQYPPPGTNWWKAGAVLSWVVAAWFALQTLALVIVTRSVLGVFDNLFGYGRSERVALAYSFAIAVVCATAGAVLFHQGRRWSPQPRSAASGHQPATPSAFTGPTEPRPNPAVPGWYHDPWGPGGRWWDGERWTAGIRL